MTPTPERPPRAAGGPAGLLVVDKPAGWTSHDVVARVRRLAGTRKVGHAGTLDPMATGVLVLGVGRATRLLDLPGRGRQDVRRDDPARRHARSPTTPRARSSRRADAAGVADGDVAAAVAAPHRADRSRCPSAVSAIKVDGKRGRTPGCAPASRSSWRPGR